MHKTPYLSVLRAPQLLRIGYLNQDMRGLESELAFIMATCPTCKAQWPGDRWVWAMPGCYHGTLSRLENRTVTFCLFSYGEPLYCPPVCLNEEYDSGLFPDVVATPCCKVIDAEIGLKWFWRVRQADSEDQFAHYLRFRAYYQGIVNEVMEVMD